MLTNAQGALLVHPALAQHYLAQLTIMFIFSAPLKRIPHLQTFLLKEKPRFMEIVLGWGHKPTADRARRYAAKHNLPYVALEEGFLRSLDLGCKGANPLSLVVDHSGIYYDAGGPSDVENLLNSKGWEKPELLASARRAIRDIVRYKLSKYNHAPDAPESIWAGTPSPRVLVVDQTEGDASVALGGANGQTFYAMLDEAVTAYAPEHVCVKTHPDVLAGKKNGFLTKYAKERGLRLIAEDYSPLSLLAAVDVVYTVTSQMGFEALLLGKRVHCFGLPFYAGWGMTVDNQVCPRRTKRRNLEELFAAAYLLYARYVHPVTGEPCSIHETIALLAEQRRQNERNRGFHACVGFRWWQKPYAKIYLHSTGGETAFFWIRKRAILAAKARGGDVVTWSSGATESLQRECATSGVTLSRMEDGFIRSVGLGSDFNWPYSLVLDKKGIYYDPSRPSELEDILNSMPQHPDHAALLERANALRTLILEKQITKYNMGFQAALPPMFPKGKTVVLVPGQVENDASVRRGGFGMSNLDLLKASRRARPNAFIVYKPHPDVESGNRQGAIPEAEVMRYADLILRNFPMGRLLPLVHEVHTLTSQTGFEALLRKVRVCTYGGPFYAGWGLTEDCAANRDFLARRIARLTLDELIAGTLLLYPTYYDWQTKNFCRAEDVCQRLLQPGGQKKGRAWTKLFKVAREVLRKVGK